MDLDVRTLEQGFHSHRFRARNVGFDAFIWRGGPGPVVVINGATHGDEYEGPTVLRQWVQRWRPVRLRGTVIMIPVLNEGAFEAGERCHPTDNGNLARAFPGNHRGSVTARLAHLFDSQVLAQATHYVDLHSGGRAYELLPWVGYLSCPGGIGRAQRAMAGCFDDFWCWAGPHLPGRTLSAAYSRGVPAIYVECRGRGGVDARDLRALDRGLSKLLRATGCVPGPPPRRRAQLLRVSRDAEEAHLQVHHPAPHAGLFVPSVALGQHVSKGKTLGTVYPLGNVTASLVKAERSGRVVLVRHQRSVRAGDALFTLAPT